MTKTLLSIILGVGCCVGVTMFAQAQSAPNPNGSSSVQSSQSSSTKHLSATGRMNEPVIRASKLMGAQVNDMSGNRAGQIRDIIVNPKSGRIDFALLSVNSAPANGNVAPNANGNLVPVPWKLLRTSAAQYSSESGQPVFTVNVDRNKLNSAPTVSSVDLQQSEWRQRVYSYYGVTPQSMGGADSDQGERKGEGARAMQGNNPESPATPQTQPPNP